jgi:hypothetical protein
MNEIETESHIYILLEQEFRGTDKGILLYKCFSNAAIQNYVTYFSELTETDVRAVLSDMLPVLYEATVLTYFNSILLGQFAKKIQSKRRSFIDSNP